MIAGRLPCVDGWRLEPKMCQMPDKMADELRSVASELRDAAAPGANPSNREVLDRLQEAAMTVANSWSGSNIGYHANVYYDSLRPPPAGAHWSSEWGELPVHLSPGGSRGDWREYRWDVVNEAIYKLAGNPDLKRVEDAASIARGAFEKGRAEIRSIVAAAQSKSTDNYLAELKSEIDKIVAFSIDEAVRLQLPTRGFMTRDTRALTGGLQPAAHQQALARVAVARSAFTACNQLSDYAEQAARHLDRITGPGGGAPSSSASGRVFIGHGGSLVWRELKDYLEDKLGLLTDEFNRVSPVGIATVERLRQMLDGAVLAFIVLTAEDERIDGVLQARQNVIHELGLFQGRLGFNRAVILLEEGCDEFSNIHGLGQIRFPKGTISPKFEAIREVVERELGRRPATS